LQFRRPVDIPDAKIQPSQIRFRSTDMNDNLNILYKIDERDRIVFVNDEWSRFARANDAPELAANEILNRSLWDFITDDTVREIYRKLIAKARANQTFSFEFRCDAPAERRLLEMTVGLRGDETVQFETRVLRREKRIRQNVFEKDFPRGEGVLKVCSWCSKIDTGGENWKEVEEAVLKLALFVRKEPPRLSHGMCGACYRKISGQFQNRAAEKIRANNIAAALDKA